MNTLIRKFTRTKWLVNTNRSIGHYSADAITGCIRTSGETLSVWVTDSKNLTSEHNKKILAGLALGMTKPDAIDVIFFDKEEVSNLGLEIIESEGQTVVGTINKFHNDIVNIDYAKLGIISKHIVSTLSDDSNAIRITKNKLIDIVCEFFGDEYSIDDLSQKWRDAIERKLGPQV